MILRSVFACVLLFTAFSSPAMAEAEGLQGSPSAKTAATRLLEAVGGSEVWAGARTMYAREQAYPPSMPGPIDVHIWRDLDAPAVRTELIGTDLNIITMRSSDRGWRSRNGVVSELSVEALMEEAKGWEQEPYVFYHRLAAGGSGLRVELKGADRLEVFDVAQDRLLCWFILTTSGAPLKWGNYFEGEINEHTYGPLRDLGPANLPKWGVSRDGSWRFEYVEVSFSDQPLEWRDHDGSQ